MRFLSLLGAFGWLLVIQGCLSRPVEPAPHVVVSIVSLPKNSTSVCVDVVNRSNRDISLATINGEPLIYFELWNAYCGLTLVSDSFYEVLSGGAFFQPQEIVVSAGQSRRFEVSVPLLVRYGIDEGDPRGWIEGLRVRNCVLRCRDIWIRENIMIYYTGSASIHLEGS